MLDGASNSNEEAKCKIVIYNRDVLKYKEIKESRKFLAYFFVGGTILWLKNKNQSATN